MIFQDDFQTAEVDDNIKRYFCEFYTYETFGGKKKEVTWLAIFTKCLYCGRDICTVSSKLDPLHWLEFSDWLEIYFEIDNPSDMSWHELRSW
jgi:hypothetical protein